MKNYLLLLFLFVFQLGFSKDQLTETDKLATTCKVWGFLKYYHPNVASGKFNWDEELYSILPKVEEAKTKEEFSTVIEDWINRLGEVPKIKIVDAFPKENYFYKNLDLSWIQNNKFLSTSLSKKLKHIEENRYQGQQYYIYEIIEDSEGTGILNLQNEKTTEDFTWEKKQFRLLTLFRYWNVIEYFAPNKYKIDKDWSSCLQDILPKIVNPKDEVSYHYALLEMVANLNDSHASYYIMDHNRHLKTLEYNCVNMLPFEVDIIDNYFVVSKLYNDALCVKNDIQMGDAIEKLDGKTVQDYIELHKNKIPASNNAYLLNQISKFHLRFPNKEIEISFSRGKNNFVKKIELQGSDNYFGDVEKSKNKEKYKILEGNIGYLNLENIYPKNLEEILLVIKEAKGLIIDIRNYPHDVHLLLADFLNSKPKEFAKQIYSDLKYPGRYIWEEMQVCGKENPNYYKGKVVILVNEESFSHSEWTAMCLRTADNAIVMGSQTAGADGTNFNFKIVMFHFLTSFTGKGVFYPDGRETQRIGIVPDIEVKPTIDGLRGMKDEVLNRAIEYIETGK
ncbi:MAG: peptidase S41 [Flavobacterium sp.]|nr:peptidase S41 [Flavobacterium sp.]